MNNKTIDLVNTTHRRESDGDKDYLEQVHISLAQLPFATRQVFVRFEDGPELDFSIVDMDRIAITYLEMRGFKLPRKLRDATKAESPPRGDFVVPNRLMARLLKTRKAETLKAAANRRACGRCGKREPDSGEWFGKLCPRCADQTEGEWICRRCKHRGNFEEMGGSGQRNPRCCGTPCKHVSH